MARGRRAVQFATRRATPFFGLLSRKKLMSDRKVGVWLLGAFGGVATTTVVGLVALRKGLAGNQGLVSQLPQFDKLGLLQWDEIVIGGHDIRDTTLFAEATQLASVSRAIDTSLIAQCQAELDEIDADIKPGVLFNVGPTIEKFAESSLRAPDRFGGFPHPPENNENAN